MTELLKLTAAAIGALAVMVAFLYVSPFARCYRCPGKRCRRCKGLGRYQRRGSRTVHRLAGLIRAEIQRTRAERTTRSKEN
jgi:hypothetical protein